MTYLFNKFCYKGNTFGSGACVFGTVVSDASYTSPGKNSRHVRLRVYPACHKPDLSLTDWFSH